MKLILRWLITAASLYIAYLVLPGITVEGNGFWVYSIMALILGLVNALIRYRSWKFFVTHMEAYGEVNLDKMSQSETVVSGHGEGLLDAFDVGAI